MAVGVFQIWNQDGARMLRQNYVGQSGTKLAPSVHRVISEEMYTVLKRVRFLSKDKKRKYSHNKSCVEMKGGQDLVGP